MDDPFNHSCHAKKSSFLCWIGCSKQFIGPPYLNCWLVGMDGISFNLNQTGVEVEVNILCGNGSYFIF